MKKLFCLLFLLNVTNGLFAQIRQDDTGYSSIDANGNISNQHDRRHTAVSLVAAGLGFHIPKGYIYFSMAFSLLVELINIQIRKKSAAK